MTKTNDERHLKTVKLSEARRKTNDFENFRFRLWVWPHQYADSTRNPSNGLKANIRVAFSTQDAATILLKLAPIPLRSSSILRKGSATNI